jgi:hypothetical protein
MKEATHDFQVAFELNSNIANTFIQVSVSKNFNFFLMKSYYIKQRALVLSFQRKYQQIILEFNQLTRLETIEDPNLYMLVAKARVKVGDNEGNLYHYLIMLFFNHNQF